MDLSKQLWSRNTLDLREGETLALHRVEYERADDLAWLDAGRSMPNRSCVLVDIARSILCMAAVALFTTPEAWKRSPTVN